MVEEKAAAAVRLYVSQIDLEELMHALKQERTAKTVLNRSKGRDKRKGNRQGKDNQGQEQRQQERQPGSGGVASDSDTVCDHHEKSAESAEENVSTAEELRSGEPPVGARALEGGGSPSRAEGRVNENATAEQNQQHQDDKEERPLFSPREVESLAAYLVESQQAFSLVNVADIQRGKQ